MQATFPPLYALVGLTLALSTACSSGGSTEGGPGVEPLTLEGLVIEPGVTGLNVSWATSQPTTALVEFGTTVLPDQSVTVGTSTDVHSVAIGGLDPMTVYYVRVTCEAADGQIVDDGPTSAMTLALGSFASADFNQPNLQLDTFTFVDPAGQATLALEGAGSGDASVRLGVPAGVAYEPWITNGAARLAQAVEDEDMVLTASFVGPLSVNGTGHGIYFQEAPNAFLRFDFAYNNDEVQLFAASFRNGSLQEMVSSQISSGPHPAGQPLFMRVSREGDNWNQQWSNDGSTWIQGANFDFVATLETAGLFVANSGNPAVAHEMVSDYVFLQGSEISPEDAGVVTDNLPPLLYRSTTQTLDSSTVRVDWFTDELAGGELRWGLDSNLADGTTPITDLEHSHSVQVTGLAANTTYFFQVVSSDAGGLLTTSPVLTATTLADGQTGAPQMEFWTGTPDGNGVPVMRFGENGDPQDQVNILGVVTDSDEDRIVDSVTLYYRLNGGTWTNLRLGDDRLLSYVPWRLANEGDFNLELFPGELTVVPAVGGVHRNTVEFMVEDDDSNMVFYDAFVDYTAGVDWALPAAAVWDDVNTLHGGDFAPVAQIVDGDWYVDNDPALGAVLRPQPDSLGYDRLIAIGEGTGAGAWTDYEATTTLKVLSLDPLGFTTGTQSFAIGFILRWSGHTTGGPFPQPRHNIYPFGGGYFYRWFNTSERWQFWENDNEAITNLSGSEVQLGINYNLRARVETLPGGESRYSMRLWEVGTSEPALWTFEQTTAGLNDHPAGSFVLVAHHADVQIGNVTITALP